MSLRLLIVDDNAHFLEAAQRLFEREGMTVVGVASTGVDALRRSYELRPDVAVVDIDLGEESGLDLARQLMAAPPEGRPRVIMISAYPERDVSELIDASPAVGFVPKSRLSGSAILEVLAKADDEAG